MTHGWADPDATPILEITLDQRQDWINANKRYHWAKRAELTRYWREVANLAARSAVVAPLERAHVTLTFHRADKREFDPSNLAPTSKACLDGLVDAGVVPDDSRRFVVGPDERYGEPGQRRIVLRVYDMDGAA